MVFTLAESTILPRLVILPPPLGRSKCRAEGVKKQVMSRLGVDGIELHLRECAHAGKKPTFSWTS